MPEEKKEESQASLAGWEDLTAHDDGSRDMGGEPPVDPEPTPVVEDPLQPAETPTEAAPEPTVEPIVEPTAQAAETQKEGTEGVPPEEPVYTLPGGKKVTQAELTADPKLLQDLVTQSNQFTDAQRIAKERKDELVALQADNRRLLDQYTDWEMKQRAMVEQPAPAEPAQRPEGKVLEGIYGPHLDKLVTDGRLSQDQRSEFGNVISEYMFDEQNRMNLISTLTAQAVQRMDAIENDLRGGAAYIVPDIQRRQQQDAVLVDQSVHQNVAARPGYEALVDPEEWNRLKLFISEKVNASPRDTEGRPTFDPMFDGDSMAQMYDAMTGADMRAALVAAKTAQAEADKLTTTMAGGETAARAGTPPLKQPSKKTPEEEAMDFGDPSMATG